MTALPDADDVFQRFFAPWYEAADLSRRGVAATRPDVEQCYHAGLRGADVSPLTSEGQAQVAAQIATMLQAARSDWPTVLGVEGPMDSAWVAAFDAYYDRARVGEVIVGSDPSDFGNDLLILCCEFGAVLGAVLSARKPQLEWIYDWPYWESALLDPAHGCRINVFHWAIKKFSDYGVDDGFAAKLDQCVDLIDSGWQ